MTARRRSAHTFAAMTSISSKATLAACAFAVLAAGSAQAATRSVDVGPGAKALPKNRTYDANAFLPGTVTVHVGDKVKFNMNGFHTVTFGDQSKTPLFIADPGKPSGEKDSQGNPFWFSDRDRIIANPAAVFPAPGVNSGIALGGKPKPFVKTFKKPGTFAYFCAVHPGMTGKVKVVAKGKKIPSQAAVAKQAAKELAAYAAKAKAADKAGQSAPNTIQAGADGKGFVNYAFYPAKATVPVNTPVTLEMSPNSSENHTFSFGPQADLMALVANQIAPAADSAPGGPPTLVASSAVFLQSDADLPAYDGTNHGNGFWSTGTLSSPGHAVDGILPSGLGKFPSKQTITFSKPGTYTYICLIHPEMQGTIEVTS
jgi:plastocyanin